MLDDQYLIRGLDALSRAHQTDYFLDGHRGAAIIAAYYLCHEIDTEEEVADIIGTMIDKHWTHTALCTPFPNESPAPESIVKIVESMDRSMGQLRQAGHNVIFPALALKAFHQLPEAITPSRVKGLCKLIESFTVMNGIQLGVTHLCYSLEGFENTRVVVLR